MRILTALFVALSLLALPMTAWAECSPAHTADASKAQTSSQPQPLPQTPKPAGG